jgi:hypothetical protein
VTSLAELQVLDVVGHLLMVGTIESYYFLWFSLMWSSGGLWQGSPEYFSSHNLGPSFSTAQQ